MLQVAGWIEAYPTARETADVVATILLEHIFPRFGFPQTLQSDNGPAFVSSVTQQVTESLNITWKLHIPYHPQSLGKVEKASGLLKAQLTKLTLETISRAHTSAPGSHQTLGYAPRAFGLKPIRITIWPALSWKS
ncbi:igE-binding protein-like [Mustela erminea]|uniref:igE-binding protein-like n=1 Tax=Mustela erminea TaxID=36723 RepID=UPI001387311B|nr:igE-binding protein-like [Mustela erminea]